MSDHPSSDDYKLCSVQQKWNPEKERNEFRFVRASDGRISPVFASADDSMKWIEGDSEEAKEFKFVTLNA